MNITIRFIIFLCISMYAVNVFAVKEVTFSSGEKQTTMIELFTSQGCSSCPPAEQWLNSLKNHQALWSEIIPIAFHVDYWDRLGWPDVYANKAYSARQYRHLQQNHVRSVYTPGLLVNGQEWRGWSRGNSFPETASSAGVLSCKVDQEKLHVSYSRAREDIVLNVALLGFGIDTNIERGENRNRTLRQEFVALSHRQFSASSGKWIVTLPREKSEHATEYALVVWVSRYPDISPVQATAGWIPFEWIN